MTGPAQVAAVESRPRVALPPEPELLTSLERPAALAAAAARVDWDRALRVGREHRLVGRLAGAMDRAGLLASVPPGPRQVLATEHRRRGRWFRQRVIPQLEEVCERLLEAGVTPVVLKGAALVCSGTIPAAHRPMGDLDLLVRPDELDGAAAVMLALGYRQRVPVHQQRWARDHHYHDPAWHHPGRPLAVEVHWGLQTRSDPLAFDVRDLGTRPLRLPGGQVVRRLDDRGQLTHLCLHFWRDRRAGSGPPLGQLWDIHDVAARLTSDDWRDVRATAGTHGHREALAATLACDRLLLDAAPIAAFPEIAATAADHRLRRFAVHRVATTRPTAVQLLTVTGDVDYSPYRMATRLLAQLRRSPERLTAVYGPAPEWRLRLKHTRMVAGLLLQLARAPSTARAELHIDRWAHGLR